MTLQGTRQLPITVHAGSKTDVRTQFAALCWRLRGGAPQVLLITTRRSGRWIIPKGWPESGMTPGEGALKEAWEEAGVKGKVHDRVLGLFSYVKRLGTGEMISCVAMVYPVKVKKICQSFPEAGTRRRRWVSLRRAASMVREPELAQILKTFDPRHLGG